MYDCTSPIILYYKTFSTSPMQRIRPLQASDIFLLQKLLLKYWLTKKLSWQWAHTTLHMPGTLGTGACGGPDGAKLITRRQFCLGHAILTDVFLHISRQLQGQRTYFRPGGAFRIGVASPHEIHFTTCCSLFPEISTRAWKFLKTKKNINKLQKWVCHMTHI